MPPDANDIALLFDMLEAAEAVIRFIGSHDQIHYAKDEILRAAVERKIEIIGEACRGISSLMKDQHPHIPWRKIAATRHVLAQDYDAVNDDIVWRIATSYLPELIAQLRPLIPPTPDASNGD